MTLHIDEGDVVVYHGDCREVMREFGEGSVAAVVTDPPEREEEYLHIIMRRLQAEPTTLFAGLD